MVIALLNAFFYSFKRAPNLYSISGSNQTFFFLSVCNHFLILYHFFIINLYQIQNAYDANQNHRQNNATFNLFHLPDFVSRLHYRFHIKFINSNVCFTQNTRKISLAKDKNIHPFSTPFAICMVYLF